MTEAEWKCLADYIRERADDLGLRDWSLTLRRTPPENEDAFAQIEFVPGRKIAYVFVNADFRDDEADMQRATIIHELLHCHMCSMQHVIEHDLEKLGALSEREHEFFGHVWLRQMEFAVDGIAESIAEKYPLISWPTKPSKK